MVAHSSSLEPELRVSPDLAIAGLIVLALILVFVSGGLSTMADRFGVALISLVLYLVAGVAWLLGRWNPWAERVFIALGLVSLVHLSSIWMEIPELKILLVLPVGIGAALAGLPAAAVAAAGATALIVLSQASPSSSGSATDLVTLAAVWGSVAVLWAMHQPVQRRTTELGEFLAHAHRLLDGARDDRAELRQALKGLRQANWQLDLTNERVSALRLVAEQALEAKAAFVAKVSHELRTPLNMIIALVDLLVETPEIYGRGISGTLWEDLKIVRRNCEHLASLVSDVLALTQAEAGRLVLQREPSDMREIVAGAVAMVQPLITKKELGLQLEVSHDLPKVSCDSTRVRQVVLNLVSNAARFTERGRIVVSVREGEGTVVVSVSDTGPGISPQHLPRVFEPFWQGPTGSAAEEGGSGLGLSICKQLVELHGGHLWLESQEGTGSTFTFDLPISAPATPLAKPWGWMWPEFDQAQRPNRAALPSPLRKPRVVTCDAAGDLYSGLRVFSDAVELVDVRDLSQAVEETRRCPAHVVVLNPPSAEDFLPALEEAAKAIPDTLLVACLAPPRVGSPAELGAIGHVTKPVTKDRLEEAMRALEKPLEHVLVVDDDPEALWLMSRLLHAIRPGLRISTASGGEAALEELRQSPPDLMLLDIMMPGMDGWQVLAAKARDERIQDIPVLFVSGYGLAGNEVPSPVMGLTIGDGVALSDVLRCSLAMSAMLLSPASAPDPVLE